MSHEPESIEAQLRAAAPDLPPELRRQVLNRCRTAPRPPLLIWRQRWRTAGAFAALLLCCGIASGRLDAQNQAMFTGDAGQPATNVFAIPADSADLNNFAVALQWRIRQLALLLRDRHSG